MFENRSDAGRRLAQLVGPLNPANTVVLALPRGGVPVAAEICAATGAPLDLLLVRKIGAPRQPELAMGAIAEGGDASIDMALVKQLGLEDAAVREATALARVELDERRNAYASDRPRQRLEGRHVLLVDDGVATGATLKAAIAALRHKHCASIEVAVPVAAPETAASIEALVDRLYCVLQPAQLASVGAHYMDFDQVDNALVRSLLDRYAAVSYPDPSH